MAHFHHFSIFNQNQSISNLVIFHQNTKAIALLFGQKCLIFITFQSSIKINQFQIGHLSPKYQGYSLTFWPKMPHFHHFSIFNQNQSISNLSHFSPKYQGYSLTFLAKNGSFSSLIQSSIKINQFQTLSHFSPKYQGYSLTSLAKNGSFSSLFNLQSKSINFKFGHFSPKYQGYSLTF